MSTLNLVSYNLIPSDDPASYGWPNVFAPRDSVFPADEVKRWTSKVLPRTWAHWVLTYVIAKIR